MFNNIKDAINWFVVQPKFKEKQDLSLVLKAYNKLNLDLSKIKTIHVAGTNGKGSTTAYLTHILMEKGFKVGSFTSPYLINFNERIRINFQEIPDDDLLKLINFIYAFNLKLNNEEGFFLSFFEMITLISLIYFHQSNVDIIIMEVGIGGLLDATNILNYNVSIITNIGYDHMKQLGNNLESIALNKLGIIKENNILYTSVDNNLKPLFDKYIKNKNSSVVYCSSDEFEILSNNNFIFDNFNYQINLLGDYQKLNALLAIKVAYEIFKIDEDTIYKGLLKTKWPGRLENIKNNIYIDGAHNISAIIELSKSVNNIFKNEKIKILFSALKDKDIISMLKVFEENNYEAMLSEFPDIRFESLEEFAKLNNYKYIKDPISYIKNYNGNEILIITGSLHFIGYLKSNLTHL